jgi:hypothetical protein
MANAINLVVAEEALKQVTQLSTRLAKADKALLAISKSAVIASNSLSKITTPKGLDALTKTNAGLNAELEKQSQIIKSLQASITQLQAVKKQKAQTDVQEAVNQGILNSNAKQAAVIQSTLAGAYKKLAAEQAKSATAVQNLVSRGKLATQTQRQYNKELKVAQADFNKLNARVLAADRAVGRFNRNVGNYPMKAAANIRSLMSAFGLYSGVFLFAAAVKHAYGVVKELDKANADLAATIGVTKSEITALTEEQIRLSLVTKYTAAEISGLQKEYAKLGFSTAEIQNATAATLSLATAVDTDLSKAASVAGSTLRAFNMDAYEMQRVVDVMAKSFNSSALDIDTFKESMKYVAPVAASAGVSIEQTAALLGVLADNGVKGSMSGTSLRRIMVDLTNSGKPFNEALKDLVKNGISLKDAFDEVGRTAQTSLIVLGKNSDKVDKLTLALKGAGGTAEKMANEQLKSLDDKTKILNSTYEVLILSMSEGDGVVSQFFKGFVDGANAALVSLINLNKGYKELRSDFNAQSAKETTEYLTTIESVIEREIAANNTRKDAISWIEKYNEKLAQAKHSYELYNAVSLLNLTPSRIRLRKKAQEDIEKYNASLGTQAGRLKAANTILDQIANKQAPKVQNKATALTAEQLKAQEDFLKNSYNAEISNLERKREIIADELEAFRGGINERISLSTLLAKKEQDIIKRKNKEARRLAKEDENLLVIAANEQITALEDTVSENAKRISGFYKELFDKASDEFGDSIFGDKYKMTDQQKDDLKEHEQKVKESLNMMQNFLNSFTSEFLQKGGLGSLTTFFDGTFQEMMLGAKEAGKEFEVTFNAVAEVAQEAFNLVSEASQRNFEGEYKRLEAQKEIALKFAGDSEFAKQRIEDQAETRRIEIAKREFKAKKEQAIFNIAIDTAQAVMATLGKTGFLGIPLSAVVAALGAVQIGVVAAQKMPQFFEGGTHDGGLMMVNDAKGSNYKETIVTPDGKIIKPEGRDVVMNAPKGTQIFTPEQWQEKELHNMLQSKGISMNESHHSNSGLTYQEMDAILGKHFKNITTQTTTFDKKGFSSYSVSKGNKTIRNENRASGQGFKV